MSKLLFNIKLFILQHSKLARWFHRQHVHNINKKLEAEGKSYRIAPYILSENTPTLGTYFPQTINKKVVQSKYALQEVTFPVELITFNVESTTDAQTIS